MLPLENEYVAIKFLVVLEDHLVDLDTMILLADMFYFELIGKEVVPIDFKVFLLTLWVVELVISKELPLLCILNSADTRSKEKDILNQ